VPGSIVVCGNMVQDTLVRPVGATLPWGATEVAESITTQLGGNAGTVSYTLGKLGIPVKLISLVGRDAAAEAVLARVRSVGVDTSLVKATEAPTSAAICLVNAGGQRAIYYQLGASAADFDEDLDQELMPGESHFHLAAVFRMRSLRRLGPGLLRAAKAAGMSTSVDTQWDHEGEWLPVLRPSLAFTDLLFVNEDEGRELTGCREAADIAHALRGLGAKEVVVKLGERGCFVSAVDGDFVSAALPVTAADTTGAGDCFVGAYLAARYRGKNHRESAELANRVASVAVQAVGATAGVEQLDTSFWRG
jgi:sugar/nucleoside kinase (ribokinase family)